MTTPRNPKRAPAAPTLEMFPSHVWTCRACGLPTESGPKADRCRCDEEDDEYEEPSMWELFESPG